MRHWLFPPHGRGQAESRFLKNWDGRYPLTDVGLTYDRSMLMHLNIKKYMFQCRKGTFMVFQGPMLCSGSIVILQNMLTFSFPNSIKMWKNIEPERRSIDSFSMFKKTLISLVHLLGVGLSPLNSHKFRSNFKDTPSNLCVTCELIEDTFHFLFKCTAFILTRPKLFQEVEPIIPKYDSLHPMNDVNTFL